MDGNAPDRVAVDVRFDVGRRHRVLADARGVLVVVEDVHRVSRALRERVHECRDRTVPLAGELQRLLAVEQPCGEPVAELARLVHIAGELVRRVDLEVRRPEEVVDLVRRELAPLRVGDGLHLLRQVDLQPAREVEPVPVFEQVRDAAFPRL